MLRLSTQKLSPSKPNVISLGCAVALIFSLGITFGLLEWRSAVESVSQLSLAAFLLYGAALVLDAWLATRQPKVEITRKASKSVSVNRWTKISLVVHHQFTSPCKIFVFDGLTRELEYQNLPAKIQLEPGRVSSMDYRIRASERGPLLLEASYVRVLSPLGLWYSEYRSGEVDSLKVYPDFSAIKAFTLLATDNHESQLGIKRKPRRGEGLEFLQLRDYRFGDSLRQIDWRASSRRNKLISKEYQDERDQHIVLLVDSGRRMRAKDDNLSHFDHTLNALLLVSYLALRQGDSVSVMSFGNDQRWVSPRKGVGSMKSILNEMYDLDAGNQASDYIGAAERLLTLQRKRSMVILVTNSRDEEIEELMMATKVLQRRHLVLVANIREAVLDELQQVPVRQLDDALTYAGVHHYLKGRNEVQQKMKNQGIYNVECLADQLAIRVANSYIEIKRSGVL